MKQLLNIAVAALMLIAPAAATAQKRVVDDVKRIISSMTVGVDQYKLAQGKIKPALSHDETKDNSETWLVAGKVQFGLYDKYMAQKSVGKTVDAKAMGLPSSTATPTCRTACSSTPSSSTTSRGSRKSTEKLDFSRSRPSIATTS